MGDGVWMWYCSHPLWIGEVEVGEVGEVAVDDIRYMGGYEIECVDGIRMDAVKRETLVRRLTAD